MREEEGKLLDWVEQEAARRKRREARDRARALPKFELGRATGHGRRRAVRRREARVSGGGRVARKPVPRRCPRYVSESAYTEEIQAGTRWATHRRDADWPS